MSIDKQIKIVKFMKAVFFLMWLLSLGFVAALALVPNLMSINTGADKMLHMLAFCMLMLWPAMTFDKSFNVVMSMLLLFSVGIGMEIMQGFIPQRNSELMDVVFNGGGIVLGSMIGYLLRDAYQALLPYAYVHKQA